MYMYVSFWCNPTCIHVVVIYDQHKLKKVLIANVILLTGFF